MPRFRTDADAWESFALSVAETVVTLQHKGRVSNAMIAALCDAEVVDRRYARRTELAQVPALSDPEDPVEILARIRARWPEIRGQFEKAMREGLD